MQMDNEKILSQILRRLDILISLQLETSVEIKNVPISNKIQKLAKLGLTSSEIASIISKPINYVTATISKMRKIKK